MPQPKRSLERAHHWLNVAYDRANELLPNSDLNSFDNFSLRLVIRHIEIARRELEPEKGMEWVYQSKV